MSTHELLLGGKWMPCSEPQNCDNELVRVTCGGEQHDVEHILVRRAAGDNAFCPAVPVAAPSSAHSALQQIAVLVKASAADSPGEVLQLAFAAVAAAFGGDTQWELATAAQGDRDIDVITLRLALPQALIELIWPPPSTGWHVCDWSVRSDACPVGVTGR